MDESTLVRALTVLEPPELEAARARAIEAVTAGVQRARNTRPKDASPSRGRTLLVASTVMAVLVGFATLTPPGKAVTTWVGEGLGIGHPGGAPTLSQLRSSWLRGTAASGEPAYVLATGQTPSGGSYELIAYKNHGAKEAKPSSEYCFELDLPDAPSSSSLDCGVFPNSGRIYDNGFGGGVGRAGDETFYTAGRVGRNAASVEVEFNQEALNVQLQRIPDEILQGLGIEPAFKFFIAFLPDAAAGGTVDITARDANNNVIATTSAPIPPLGDLGPGIQPPAGSPE